MTNEPFTAEIAQELARAILENGTVQVLEHAAQRMLERGLSLEICLAVIRNGEVGNVQKRKGTWRYRFDWNQIGVPVLFLSETALWIITAAHLHDEPER
jgi:hypothetical protein